MPDPTLDSARPDADTKGPDDDMRAVVTGPIGHARLVDPATAEAHGEGEDAPPTVETDEAPTD
jgi:hypothetical protein